MNFRVFVHFLKNNLIWDHETYFTGTFSVLSAVCANNGPCGSNFFRPQIGSIFGFSSIFLKSFHLIYKLVGASVVAVWRICYRCRIGSPYKSKFGFSTILLKSFFWIHFSLVLYAHWSYFQRCVQCQYGPQGPTLWAILDSKVSPNSGLWSRFQNLFTGFTTLHAQYKYFQWFVGYGPWRPNLGAILGSKISHNANHWSFPQNVFTGFTPVLGHMVIASTFRCVDNMGMRGRIFFYQFGPQNW